MSNIEILATILGRLSMVDLDDLCSGIIGNACQGISCEDCPFNTPQSRDLVLDDLEAIDREGDFA